MGGWSFSENQIQRDLIVARKLYFEEQLRLLFLIVLALSKSIVWRIRQEFNRNCPKWAINHPRFLLAIGSFEGKWIYLGKPAMYGKRDVCHLCRYFELQRIFSWTNWQFVRDKPEYSNRTRTMQTETPVLTRKEIRLAVSIFIDISKLVQHVSKHQCHFEPSTKRPKYQTAASVLTNLATVRTSSWAKSNITVDA